VTNVEQRKALKKAFEEVMNEIPGLTDDQIYCHDNTVYTDSAKKKLITIFREENLIINLNQSVN
jgi:fructose-1,6-bisphosphatase